MRAPRPLAIPACIGLAAAAVVAGIAWTPIAFLAIPFLLVAGYATWRGVSGEDLLEALETDPGSGPAGLH